MDILKCLEKKYQYLSENIRDLNKIVFVSPHSAIIKGRIISEYILNEVAKLEDYESIKRMQLWDKIKTLESEGVLGQEINDTFHEIRLIGNKAAHTNIEGELERALKTHRNVYKIVCWFVEAYVDYQFECSSYKSPVPEQDKDLGMNKETIMNIIKEFMKDKDKVIDEVDIDKGNNDKIVVKDKHNIRCLVQELSKLRESSKEAVESLGEFTDFKRYMHVEREAQKKLEELIFKANESNKAQLILVSGSVGDGKSHIISYFNNRYPEIMNNFTLHNDATESMEPNKTSADTLNDVLDDFNDDNIEKSNKKIILAINLGTLNNFIDSEYGEKFSFLKEYVHDKKILETNIKVNNFDENCSFQFINFSDYHIFTLKDGKVHSEYIKSLIDKITAPSELNVFYSSYKRNCANCKNIDCCPIKSNYELLSKEEVQISIIDLLVQCVIKNKIIISTRALLNFIYELIVPISYIDVNLPTFKNDIFKLNNLKYIKALMPNVIFNHKELSFIFDALSSLDPIDIRNQKVDSFIIKFNNSIDLVWFFDEYIDLPKGYMTKVNKINFEETQDSNIKHELLKLFIRTYHMYGQEKLFSLKDHIYEDYMKNMYYWNKGDRIELVNLYNDVKNGILKWNGQSAKGQINIFIGNNQNKYKVSEDIELKADTSNLVEHDEKELKKFMTTLRLRYKSEKSDESHNIDIDFALYKLLRHVNEGYRPNKKDKNQFVNFIEFINKLEEAGSQNQKLIFTEKNREQNKKYKLEYDSEFKFYRFMEI